MRATSPSGRLGWVQIDCRDPEDLARFWGVLLGVEIRERVGSSPVGPRYVVLEPRPGSDVAVAFQWVPEVKTVKNRLHLDVVAEAGLEEVTRRVKELGGARHPWGDQEDEHWRWRVMTDPEGNEFCLIPPE